MRVISFNANGIRAAAQKGFFEWMREVDADIICIQETKALRHQLMTNETFHPETYHCVYVDAKKPGYSGVAIYSKHKPDHIIESLNVPISDDEGRYSQFNFPKLIIASIYMPSGTSGDARQAVKYEFLEAFEKKLTELRQDGRHHQACRHQQP